MKASIKYREDQKPLFRAKVPLNILGFSFQSGIAAGDSKELCLNVSTFFESGPSLKLEYHPNDPWNPFSFVVKSGIGHFGSPVAAPMTISAEFNLLSRGSPSFFLHFRPQIGNFSIKKSSESPIALPSQSTSLFPKIKSDAEGSIDGSEMPLGNGNFPGKGVSGFPMATTGVIDNLLSGLEINARTLLPIRNRAKLNLRWGVRFPAELKEVFMEDRIKNPTAEISLGKIPFLVLSKVGIELVSADITNQRPNVKLPGNADLAEAFFTFKRQLEVVQEDNGLLRKAVESLRSEIEFGKPVQFAGKQDSGNYRKIERTGGKSWEFGGLAGNGKAMDGDENEEWKKGSMGATGAGI